MNRMSVVQPANSIPAESFPFANAGSADQLFPPVCLKYHWDPTVMLKYILPDKGQGSSLPLPMDFRPYVKVCKNYVTSAPAVEAPLPPANVVFPSGGEFYPPGRYSNAIDNESKLHYLDRRLNRWCQKDEWVPSVHSDMSVPNVMVPKSAVGPSPFVQELAMPQSLLRTEAYDCRSGDDKVNWENSARLFNNPTKQDRWGKERYYALPGGKLIFPHGESQRVPPTAQARAGAMNIPRPGGDGVSEANRAFGGIKPIYEPQDHYIRIRGLSSAGNQAPA